MPTIGIALKLMAIGFCFGVGYWVARKATNFIESHISLRNPYYLRQDGVRHGGLYSHGPHNQTY
jgi:hypothetical protein